VIGWLDPASGASGDMLLGAVIDAGAPEETVVAAIHAVTPEPVTVRTEVVRRSGLAARRAVVDVADSTTTRGLSDVLALVTAADLDEAVARSASEVFRLLASAEAAVHGSSVEDVHFHEVGALDAIADIVGVCSGFVALALKALHCGPVAVGSGSVSTTHGSLSVPPPAVVELLRGVPTYAGPVASEMCTPTGAALLRHWVTAWGPQPLMQVDRVGVGAGGRDVVDQPNVLRLLVGAPGAPEAVDTDTSLVMETNVDDLDPRLWPAVLQRLLAAGAADAWLTPILMKKGRPAHTLSVLTRSQVAGPVRATIFAETSAIGLREIPVGKQALDREFATVDVSGHVINVKIARHLGRVVNVQPEYDEVAAAAEALDRPAKAVLADAVAAASLLWEREQS
jgi:pyridinium-3,5-bisthiocarboxylic acid mononucleotide nickel chelatase